MPRGGIPDRWLDYSNVGKVIDGTPFIAFKVPLKEGLCRLVEPEQRFSPGRLLQEVNNLGLVIDFTNTKRYYESDEFTARGVQHCKIQCPGRVIPSDKEFESFVEAVEKFLKTKPGDKLIGVHCTHGLNRTGYIICRYMIKKMGFSPEKAVKGFEVARGHQIERTEYLIALGYSPPPGEHRPTRSHDKRDHHFHHVNGENNRDSRSNHPHSEGSARGPSDESRDHRNHRQREPPFQKYWDDDDDDTGVQPRDGHHHQNHSASYQRQPQYPSYRDNNTEREDRFQSRHQNHMPNYQIQPEFETYWNNDEGHSRRNDHQSSASGYQYPSSFRGSYVERHRTPRATHPQDYNNSWRSYNGGGRSRGDFRGPRPHRNEDFDRKYGGGRIDDVL